MPSCRLAALIVAAGAAAIAAPPASDPLYRTLRDSSLADTLLVANVVLKRDAGTVTLKSGSLAFTAPANGRDTEAVFVGEGEFAFTPALFIDRNYLKSITGDESVKEPFDRALFVFTDDAGKEFRAQAKPHAADPKLADALRDFRNKLRRRNENPRSFLEALLTSESMDNVEADVLADLFRTGQPGFFSAYLHGRKHSDLRFHVKPRGVLPALPSPEEVAVLNLDPGGDQDGIWSLEHFQDELKNGRASSDEEKRAVEAESYRIETSIAKNDRFTASTTLRLHAVAGGDRVIKFGLLPTLRVSRVSVGGQDVPFIQEDKKDDPGFYVVMPQPMERGAALDLLIEYAGDKVVHKEGGGNFSVGARESWYPNVNTFRDHAKYDLTFKVPKQYTLVSVGKLEKEWTEEGQGCTHWVSAAPIAVAGFNYGSFKKKTLDDPKLNFGIEGYATTEVPDYLKGEGGPMGESMAPSRLIDRTLAETRASIQIFNMWFGPSEFGRIAITQQPEFSFGQSWPSLVYLPLSAYLDATQRFALMGIQNRFTEFIDEVTPHEVSHQWWGHIVGWPSYHDQWLSEGFAFFSAALFLQYTEKTPDKYLKYWEHARDLVLEKNNYNRRPNDAGPLWLGIRLGSMKNPRAYDALVYRKGGYVLYMLRQMMWDPKEGDKPFIAMMHDFVSQYANKNASTEAFQRVAEKHMNANMDAAGDHRLDWFFSNWVYGTAIPRYKFDYKATDQADGKCEIEATLTQSDVPENFIMLVPIYADFDGRPVRLGSVRMVGSSTADHLKIMLPKRPKRLAINLQHDVLAQP
ncbi:MAG TPA: M1 family aminopeptidase [Bryobacteraceae bacterium]